MSAFSLAEIPSPLGVVSLLSRDDALVLVGVGVADSRIDRAAPDGVDRVSETAASLALSQYFDGDVAAIDGLAADPPGTPFQKRVWAALREIPAGEVISYGTLAARVGNPKASRAVGAANGRNPVGIVIPCHRVIGANGTLTGYAGGIDRKRWLLEHERRQTDLFTAAGAATREQTS